MNIKIVCLLVIILFVLLLVFLPKWRIPSVVSKPRDTRPLASTHGNFETAGITVRIGRFDDPTTNATAALEYRPDSSTAWRAAFPLARADQTHFVGSLFALTPATVYDVRVRFSDPAKGPLDEVEIATSVTTRAEVAVPESGARAIHVAPKGSDETGDGSARKPLATVARALHDIQAGDQVILRGGAYYEGELELHNVSGTPSAPVVIRGYPGEVAILDGSDRRTYKWTSIGGGVFEATLDSASSLTHLVAYDGARLFPYEKPADALRKIHGVPGFHVQGKVIRLCLPPGSNPAKRPVVISRFNHAFHVANSNNIHFKNLTFRYYGHDATGSELAWPKAIHFEDADDCIVDACRFTLNDLGIAVAGATDRLVVQDCQFEDTVFDWPYEAVKNGRARPETGAVRIVSPYTGRGLVIRRNEVHDLFNGFRLCPSEEGPWNKVGVSNETDCHDNFIYRIDGSGIDADGQSVNTRIWGNTFTDCMVAISLSPTRGGPAWCLRNLAYGVEPDGGPTQLFRLSHNSYSGPVYLFHNTAVTEKGFYLGGGAMEWRLVYSRNNIWCAAEGPAFQIESPAQPIDWDYDNFQAAGQARAVGVWGQVRMTLERFQDACRQERHGKAGDPGFAGARSGDFTLGPASPLIDAGARIPGINDGHVGAAPDIGCFEFGDARASRQAQAVRIPLTKPKP